MELCCFVGVNQGADLFRPVSYTKQTLWRFAAAASGCTCKPFVTNQVSYAIGWNGVRAHLHRFCDINTVFPET